MNKLLEKGQQTPEEKAKVLVDKFYETIENNVELYSGEYLITSKQCALICVFEMIEALGHHTWQNQDCIGYYEEVKKEISK